MKKSIFKRIGLIALAVCVAIGSFFVPLKSKKQNNFASADSVDISYSFTASDLYHINIYSRSNVSSEFFPVLFSCDFSSDAYGVHFSPNFSFLSLEGTSVSYTDCNYFYVSDDLSTNIYSSDNVYFDTFSLSPGLYRFLPAISSSNILNSQNFFNGSIKIDTGFTANIYKIVLSVSSSGFRDDYSNFDYLHISYYDINDNALTFEWYVPSDYVFNTRTYYIVSSDNLTDNQIYNQGYQQGLADNQQNIYNNGYDAGYDVGYGSGKSDGIASANDYSFIGLIGAVIDVPVQTIRGMLNFTFLGINLFDFLMGLIAILVILFIVKLVRGG